jgi:hypothetical protein
MPSTMTMRRKFPWTIAHVCQKRPHTGSKSTFSGPVVFVNYLARFPVRQVFVLSLGKRSFWRQSRPPQHRIVGLTRSKGWAETKLEGLEGRAPSPEFLVAARSLAQPGVARRPFRQAHITTAALLSEPASARYPRDLAFQNA